MDCSFQKDNEKFRYRACGIIIEDGNVLFVKNEKDDYYYSIGGAVMVGETVEDAVKREVFEETGEKYEIERFVFFHENFFTGSGTLEGLECHEIAFYFLMKSKGEKVLKCNSTATCGAKESLHWLPIDKLHSYKAYPEFFADKLLNLSDGPEHIVTKNEKNNAKKIVINEHLYLQAVKISNADNLFNIVDNNRPYLKKWLRWVDFIKEPKNQEDFIKDCIDKANSKSEFDFAIHYKDEIIGFIALKDIDYLNKRAEIGYWIAEKYSGQGIMTKACKAVIDFAFNELELNRLTILTATENFASQGVAKKLGFTLEGTLKDNECLYDKFVDNYCFSLIKREK